MVDLEKEKVNLGPKVLRNKNLGQEDQSKGFSFKWAFWAKTLILRQSLSFPQFPQILSHTATHRSPKKPQLGDHFLIFRPNR